MDLDKIWEDLQGRATAVLDKSHVLLKYVALIAITFLAFALRVVGFVRTRGINEVEDIFNLAMTDRLSSAGLTTFLHEGAATENAVVYPGLVAFIHAAQCFLGHVGVTFSTQTLYTLAGPFFASCTALATYLLGKELKDETTGLVAAGILSLLPGFFALSVDGRNANVVGGSLFAVLVVLFFMKAVKQHSYVQAFFAGVAYFLLSSFWSGYVFVQVLLSGYVLILLLSDKCTANVHTAFSVFFIVGNVLNVLIPAGGFFPFLHLDFFPGLAAFVLLQMATYGNLPRATLMPSALVLLVVFVAGGFVGFFSPSAAFSVFWAQLTSGNGSTWLTFFKDLHLVLFLFPAGVFLCFRKKTAVNVFLVVYAAFSLFLASVSSHFVAVLFPVASILGSLGLSSTFKIYLRNQEAPTKRTSATTKPLSKEINVAVLAGLAAVAGFFLVYSFSAATHPTVYQPNTVFPAVSQSSNEFSWVDDLREAVSWLKHNTANDTRIVTWRGLGQQLRIFRATQFLVLTQLLHTTSEK